MVFAAIFWFALLKASMLKVPSWQVAILAGVVMYLGTFLKEQHGFARVQTILSMVFHTSQLVLPPKKKECRAYLLLPITHHL